MATTNSIQSDAPLFSAAQAAEYLDRLEGFSQRHVSQFEGRRMVWRRFGDGRPVILLHGGHGSWLHLDSQHFGVGPILFGHPYVLERLSKCRLPRCADLPYLGTVCVGAPCHRHFERRS